VDLENAPLFSRPLSSSLALDIYVRLHIGRKHMFRHLKAVVAVLVIAIGSSYAEAAEAQKTQLKGWINSPILKNERTFDDSQAVGVKWLLTKLDSGYQDAKDQNATKGTQVKPVAELEYNKCLQVQVYPSSLIKVKKLAPSSLFKRIKIGKHEVYRVGNMKCDLILDVLTIPIGNGQEDTVLPSRLLPHLGEQYGAGMLSHAVTWRVVDRSLGWPKGKIGLEQLVLVAEELEKQCYSEKHRKHNWCYNRLKKLAEESKEEKIKSILKRVEEI